MPEYCPTCNKPYVKKLTSDDITFCINWFHRCRDCKWYLEQRVNICSGCEELEIQMGEQWAERHGVY